LSPSSQSVALGGKASFSGSNFTPNTQVTLKYYKASVLTTTWYVISGCTGKFATSVTTASGILRTDKVTACDLYSRCASATITIIA
jgi:hypothetical protein